MENTYSVISVELAIYEIDEVYNSRRMKTVNNDIKILQKVCCHGNHC